MKRCAQCHGKLGLGVRSRNLWSGRWWIPVRYCSTHCEARHELERRERQISLLHTFLFRKSAFRTLLARSDEPFPAKPERRGVEVGREGFEPPKA